MKLIIDIPETLYEVTKDMIRNDMGTSTINKAIANGIPYESCEDAISRHKAIVMITAYEGKSAQIEALEQLSSVNPQEPCDKCEVGNPCLYCKHEFEPRESDHKCHTCKHYTSGENDGSCGSYICKGYSNWESEDKE